MTFSGVASNFAGVPLALAFMFTLGRVGLLTAVPQASGLGIYDAGFNLYSKSASSSSTCTSSSRSWS